MNEHVFAKTIAPQPGGYYPTYFNFTQTGPCEVTLTTRAKEDLGKGYPDAGPTTTYVLEMDDVVKLSFFLNQVIARFTSNA